MPETVNSAALSPQGLEHHHAGGSGGSYFARTGVGVNLLQSPKGKKHSKGETSVPGSLEFHSCFLPASPALSLSPGYPSFLLVSGDPQLTSGIDLVPGSAFSPRSPQFLRRNHLASSRTLQFQCARNSLRIL